MGRVGIEVTPALEGQRLFYFFLRVYHRMTFVVFPISVSVTFF